MDQRSGVKRGVEPGADLPLSGRVNRSTTCMTIEQSQDGGCATSQRGQDYGHGRNGFKARQEGQEAIECGWEIRIEAAAGLATLDQEWRQPARVGDLLGMVGLRRGQGGLEIRDGLALAEMERGINLQRRNVPRPAKLHGFGGIPEPIRRLVEFVQERKVMIPGQLCKGRLRNCGLICGCLCTRQVHN